MADPHFASVVLLLGNDNAADGTTTFLDQAGTPHTITRVADTVYDDAQAASGMTSSILFDGTGDRLSAVDSDDWYFGAGDFTIEFYVRHAATQSHRYISQWNSSTSFIVDLNVGTLRLVTSDSSGVQQNVTNAWAPTDGVWYHVAAVRDGNVGRLYVDGTQLNSAAITHTLRNSTEILEIGSLNAGGAGVFNGNMDSLRVTKGVCRYPGGTAFTPPPLPLPITAVDAPVADFSGTPLSGDVPLTVQFTDLSTNTPTSWLWEKNDGSGWSNFDGTPTAQNPSEDFADGTWSVRLTATNAGGSDSETKTDYITVSSSSTVTAVTSGVRNAKSGKFAIKLADLKNDQSTADFLKAQLRLKVPERAFDAQTDAEKKKARKEKRLREQREAKMRADAEIAARASTESKAAEISAEVAQMQKASQRRKQLRTLMSLAAMVA